MFNIYLYNFEYDGETLSSFGYIVCEFNDGGGVNVSRRGSEISFVTTPINGGKRYIATGSKYDKCLSTTFQICKDPDAYDKNEMSISDEEFRELSRWLSRREFLWFRNYDGETWFRATFNLSKIKISDVCYGVELSMSTDSPFGYGDLETIDISLNQENGLTDTFSDYNDEIGETYPDMIITCQEDGDLSLTNDVSGCSMLINNCSQGEVISIRGENMLIHSSIATHDIANDFNYDFYHFGNTFLSRINTITASIPCSISMKYRPIHKNTL